METNKTRIGKYSEIIFKEKKIPKMKKPNKNIYKNEKKTLYFYYTK